MFAGLWGLPAPASLDCLRVFVLWSALGGRQSCGLQPGWGLDVAAGLAAWSKLWAWHPHTSVPQFPCLERLLLAAPHRPPSGWGGLCAPVQPAELLLCSAPAPGWGRCFQGDAGHESWHRALPSYHKGWLCRVGRSTLRFSNCSVSFSPAGPPRHEKDAGRFGLGPSPVVPPPPLSDNRKNI